MKKVLLFSGGFDSFLIALLEKPDVLLYFDVGVGYSHKEIEHIQKIKPLLPKNCEIVIDYSLNLGLHCPEDSVMILNRNLIFAAQAMNYGNEILFGFVRSDNAPDKTEKFLEGLDALMLGMVQHRDCDYSYNTCKIHAPYHKFSKSELLKLVIAKNTDNHAEVCSMVQNIRSCYSGESDKGCGECDPCVQKAVALFNNDLYYNVEKIFDKDPATAIDRYIKDFKKHKKDINELENLQKFQKSVTFSSIKG